MTKALTAKEANEYWQGTHLQAYVPTTRAKIESVFGAPTVENDDPSDKVTTEWVIRFDDGTIATIYDWKRYEEGAPAMNEQIVWHIGGHSLDARNAVEKALGEVTHAGYPFYFGGLL